MSNKSRSQRSSASAPDDNPPSSRRARRKEKQSANAEAGPSNSTKTGTDTKATQPTSVTHHGESSFTEADFIPFAFSEPEPEPVEKEEARRARSPPTREWDRGKGKAKATDGRQESDHAGRKRKAEEIDFNDGYASKKERLAASSRRAPWAKDLKWEECANVAEM